MANMDINHAGETSLSGIGQAVEEVLTQITEIEEGRRVMPEQGMLDFGGPVLTEEQRLIHSLLCKGRANARSVKCLSLATGINGVRVRQIIKHLVEEHAILVVSSTANPPGFFFPETKEEYGAGVGQLVHRIVSLARRLRALDIEFYEQILGGSRLPLDINDRARHGKAR